VAGGLIDPNKQVRISVNGPNFTLPSQQATSCALVMNELLQNAVEHGFAGRISGSIQIRFRETDSSMVIEIDDDGIGLPAEFDLTSTKSLGLQIVQTLVRDDLRGQLQLIHDEGVTARISFPIELCRMVA
jgi:two-component sensor histidine kinase